MNNKKSIIEKRVITCLICLFLCLCCTAICINCYDYVLTFLRADIAIFILLFSYLMMICLFILGKIKLSKFLISILIIAILTGLFFPFFINSEGGFLKNICQLFLNVSYSYICSYIFYRLTNLVALKKEEHISTVVEYKVKGIINFLRQDFFTELFKAYSLQFDKENLESLCENLAIDANNRCSNNIEVVKIALFELEARIGNTDILASQLDEDKLYFADTLDPIKYHAKTFSFYLMNTSAPNYSKDIFYERIELLINCLFDLENYLNNPNAKKYFQI